MFNPLWVNCQKRPNTIRLRYPVPGTVLVGTGAGAGFEKMAGYPANRNRNRVSGTSLATIRLMVAIHQSISQFECTPYSIWSHLFNLGLSK